jgi:tRNA uridine 5-carboxymethylaminomethyl modification enzyme
MFTSRAEYRLLLREDNADARLTPVGRELGVVGDKRWQVFEAKQDRISREQQRLAALTVRPGDLTVEQSQVIGRELSREQKADELLKRPEVTHAFIEQISSVGPRPRPPGESAELTEQIGRQIEIQARYAGYLRRQEQEIERSRNHATMVLPDHIDYDQVLGLSNEVRQKLLEIRPATLGQASRIPGMTPAAVSLLLVHLKKGRLKSA